MTDWHGIAMVIAASGSALAAIISAIGSVLAHRRAAAAAERAEHCEQMLAMKRDGV